MDTLRFLFQGRKELFAGLYIEHRWDWSMQYPVISFDFANGITRSRAELDEWLIQQVAKQFDQPAVILIDEYDKPILYNIDQPEIATLCGYTQPDLENQFAGHLQGVDWQQLKDWYNGYQFLGEPVYNPFDILLFISEGHKYRNYWFETGSTAFLIKLFQQRQYFLPDLEDIEVGEEILDSFDVENISPITLLFQSGYLTIRESVTRFGGQPFYKLRLPNQEVRQSFATQLAGSYSHQPAEMRNKIQHNLFEALASGDLPALESHIKALFAGIPWRNFAHNELADSEGW